MPKILRNLLSWIDRLLDPQPAEEPEVVEAEPIDFETFFTEPLYPD